MDTHSNGAPGSRTMSVRELRGNLAEALRRADAGERSIVTSGGRAVAQLGPLDADAPELERLVSSGAVVPPRRLGEWRAADSIQVWAGTRIDQALRELRG